MNTAARFSAVQTKDGPWIVVIGATTGAGSQAAAAQLPRT